MPIVTVTSVSLDRIDRPREGRGWVEIGAAPRFVGWRFRRVVVTGGECEQRYRDQESDTALDRLARPGRGGRGVRRFFQACDFSSRELPASRADLLGIL